MSSKNTRMNKKLGDRIALARKRAGLTQEELAKKLDIAYPTLNKYERGHRIPDAELLSRMVKLLDCDPGWLLTGEGSIERKKASYASIDEELIIEIAEAVQEFLEKEKLELPFIKKIELILYFYKRIQSDKIKRSELTEDLQDIIKFVA